jgi:SAM-dependent methyltransferase
MSHEVTLVSPYVWQGQQCPICVNSSARYMGRRGGSAHPTGRGEATCIYRCTECGLIFPNPMPVPSAIDEHYDDPECYFSEHSLEGKTAGYSAVLDSFEQLGVRPGRLLDVGAGRGEGLRAACERGWQAVGLEPSSKFAQAARLTSGAEVVETPLEERPFPESSFDAVLLGAVLEHVFNPHILLAEIHRVLRPGGILWLDVPNEAGAFFVLGNIYHRARGRDWVVNLSPTFPPYHVFGFTPRSLQRLLKNTGFRVARLQTYATPGVISTTSSPVPQRLRPLVQWLLRLGPVFGAGTYMDAWATKQ